MIECPNCHKLFEKRKKSAARYCSYECANAIRSKALREHRAPPRPRRGRTHIPKTCAFCGGSFTVTTANRRQPYCSHVCGSKVANRGRRIEIPEDAIRAEMREGRTLIEISESLGVSMWTLIRRMKEHGLTQLKPAYKLRSDGYWNYHTPINHRRIAERNLGRKLLPREHVHHIDGDKTNNEISNLVIINGTRAHAILHHSLERCGYELIKKGLIKFDPVSCSYVLLLDTI